MSLINRRGYKKSHFSLPVPGKRMAVHFRMHATDGRVARPLPKYHRDVRGEGRNEHCDRPGKQWPPQSIWNKPFLIATIIRVLLNQRPFELEGALVQTLHFTDEQTKSQRRL